MHRSLFSTLSTIPQYDTHRYKKKKELKIAVNLYPLGEVDGKWTGGSGVGAGEGVGWRENYGWNVRLNFKNKLK